MTDFGKFFQFPGIANPGLTRRGHLLAGSFVPVSNTTIGGGPWESKWINWSAGPLVSAWKNVTKCFGSRRAVKVPLLTWIKFRRGFIKSAGKLQESAPIGPLSLRNDASGSRKLGGYGSVPGRAGISTASQPHTLWYRFFNEEIYGGAWKSIWVLNISSVHGIQAILRYLQWFGKYRQSRDYCAIAL